MKVYVTGVPGSSRDAGALRRHLALTALPALLLTACTTAEPANSPAEPSEVTTSAPSSESASKSPPPSAPASSAPASTDPLTFDSTGHGCQSIPGRYILWETFRSDRPVTLTGVDLGLRRGIRITDQSVTEQPQDIALVGMVKGPMLRKYREDIGWDERGSVAGYDIEPGTSYYLFVHLRLTQGGAYDGIDVGWDDGQATGTSRWDDKLTVRKNCE